MTFNPRSFINASISVTKASLEWFRNAISTTLSGSPDKKAVEGQEDIIGKETGRGIFKPSAFIEIGKMYLFHYDPKYKKVLPIYDEFPLVFPFNFFKGGFIGINLHYLPTSARINILKALIDLASDTKYDDNTRLKLSYQELKKNSILFKSAYKGCVKKYLYTHVISTFNLVSPADWQYCVLLPLEKFVYNSRTKSPRNNRRK